MFFARGSVRIEGLFFFFQAEDGIRDTSVTGVQTCALPISAVRALFGACNAQSASEATLDVLVGLVTPETLPAYLDALRSPSDGITDAATREIGRASCRERVEIAWSAAASSRRTSVDTLREA